MERFPKLLDLSKKTGKTHKTHLPIAEVANQIFNYQLGESLTARGRHWTRSATRSHQTQPFSVPFSKTLPSQPATTFHADLSGAWSWAPEHGCVNYTRRPAARPCRLSSQHQIWRELSLKPNKQNTIFQKKLCCQILHAYCILHFLCSNTASSFCSETGTGLQSPMQAVKEGLLLLCCVSLIWIKVVKVNTGERGEGA